jgi:hypothetical protein
MYNLSHGRCWLGSGLKAWPAGDGGQFAGSPSRHPANCAGNGADAGPLAATVKEFQANTPFCG